MILETLTLSALLIASSSTPAPITNGVEPDTLEDVVAAGVTVETPLFRVGPASGGGGLGKPANPE
jgi:hypothetical protein